MTCPADVALALKCDWMMLSMVILLSTVRVSLLLPSEDSSVASVHLVGKAEDQQRYGAIRLLRPQHASASDLAWVNLAAQQLAHQMTAKWPHIHLFSLANVKVHVLGMAIIAQIAKGNWSSLKALNLSSCGLNAQDLLMVIQGDWPVLKHLDVSDNCLDAEGMALLGQGELAPFEDT